MSERNIFERILWAVDPLTQDKTAQDVAAQVLKTFSRSISSTIQPLSVILEDQIPYLVGDYYNIQDFRGQLETKLNHWLTQLHFPELSHAKLLVEKEFSIKSGVQTLLNFAVEKKYELIVATTHAKKRNGGTELGTFAETLFLYSKTPLLLISPRTKISSSYKEIFFPTDLSLQSLRALKTIESVALKLKAHVTLFHKMFSFAKDVVEFPYSTDARSNYLEQLHSDQQNQLKTIIERMKTLGISASFIIDRIEADYVSNSILQRAERMKECFIALASHTGISAASLPGSVTRQVIRNASMPVLILHPERDL